MNRRSFFRGLFALPLAAIAGPLSALARKPFADGGIVAHDIGTVTVHRCDLPISMECVRSKTPRALVVEIRCNAAKFRDDLKGVSDSVRELMIREIRNAGRRGRF